MRLILIVLLQISSYLFSQPVDIRDDFNEVDTIFLFKEDFLSDTKSKWITIKNNITFTYLDLEDNSNKMFIYYSIFYSDNIAIKIIDNTSDINYYTASDISNINSNPNTLEGFRNKLRNNPVYFIYRDIIGLVAYKVRADIVFNEDELDVCISLDENVQCEY